MKCLKCKTEMIQRSGKHGLFWCCPKSNPSDNHGTFSTRQQHYNTSFHKVSLSEPDPLMRAIERQTMALGGYLTDLDRFVEGSPDEEDHWMNGREY